MFTEKKKGFTTKHLNTFGKHKSGRTEDRIVGQIAMGEGNEQKGGRRLGKSFRRN